jgi:hypothetical protein
VLRKEIAMATKKKNDATAAEKDQHPRKKAARRDS